jgi:hypothetical protein
MVSSSTATHKTLMSKISSSEKQQTQLRLLQQVPTTEQVEN